jgi:hypothetical protein
VLIVIVFLLIFLLSPTWCATENLRLPFLIKKKKISFLASKGLTGFFSQDRGKEKNVAFNI